MYRNLPPRKAIALLWGILTWAMVLACTPCWAEDIEKPPIEYSRTPPANRVTRLQEHLDRGERSLEYHPEFGYLPAALRELQIGVHSQVLVFSKTSLQSRVISPKTPRAIYFNDDVYLGYCQNGELLELSVADPELGAVFFTMSQRQVDRPKFERRTNNCLGCHSSPRTESVPAHFARSLFVDVNGEPMFSNRSYVVDHATPMEVRWGGWYVTGKHGMIEHRGNLAIDGKKVPVPLDNSQGQNLMHLEDRIDVSKYLAGHSDIAALMVLEHQTLLQNRIAKAMYVAKRAMHQQSLNREAPSESRDSLEEESAGFHKQIQLAGESLVESLLMVDEAPLLSPIEGSTSFGETYRSTGIPDAKGRSLKELDLQQRLFRFPCSPQIYTEAFLRLPKPMKDFVMDRMVAILEKEDTEEKYKHLSAADRKAILEILRDTHPWMVAW